MFLNNTAQPASKNARILITWVTGILFALTTTFSYSQGSRNFISASGGYSLPIGKYASERLSNPDYGLAGSGYFGQIAYEHRFLFWLGIRLAGNVTINKTNPDPIVAKSNEYLERVRPFINEEGTYTWKTDASQWKQASAMVGPVLYLYLGKVQLEGHLMGGYVIVESPDILVTGESSSGNNPVEGSLASARSKTWGAGAGASIKIPLSRHLSFQLGGDLIGTEAKFDDLVLVGKIGNYDPLEQPRSEHRLVSVINIGAGFTIEF
jgi:hypothetical protein